MLAEKRCIQTGSHRKQPPQADSQEKREQAKVQPLCPVRPVKKSKVSVPVSPWFCLLNAFPLVARILTDLASLVSLAKLALPLVVRFGRSATQILQNGPRQLGQLGCAPCSPSGGPFSRSAAQILQSGPRQLGLLGCAPCSPSGGPFWPLSSPNAPKRTLPAASAWLCSLLSLWWSVLAAQQPKSSKMDLASLVSLAVLLALPLAVRFGRSAAQILQNGPRHLCRWSVLAAPSKRTSPALPTSSVSVLLSAWCSVLSAERPKSSKTDIASFVCLAVVSNMATIKKLLLWLPSSNQP